MNHPGSFSRESEPEPTLNSERKSGFVKIVGILPEEAEKELERTEHVFTNQEFMEDAERKKTPEEIEMINFINEKMGGFVREYGGESLHLKPEHIHLADASKLTKEQKQIIKKAEKGAEYRPESQSIIVWPARSKLKLAQHIVHEVLHFSAFQSLTKKRDGLYFRRQGLRIWTEKEEGEYFYDLDEAIIAELTKRFDRKYFGEIPYLKEEFKNRERFIKRILPSAKDDEERRKMQDIAYAYTKETKTKDGRGKVKAVIDSFYSYQKERDYLDTLINEIYTKNLGRFNSQEEVFRVFARAVFSGKLSELACLIEATYGKGSFRRLAKKTLGTPKKSSE